MNDKVLQQRDYWDDVAETKTFSHPLNSSWLTDELPRTARLLDFGCGYGRIVHELWSLGYQQTLGLDFSPDMIARGRRTYPMLDLRFTNGVPTADTIGHFDGILLFAVLTCNPDGASQERLIGQLAQLLRPGGLLYISDYPVQTDQRSTRRYDAFLSKYGTYGIFETSDGAIVRHHDSEWLAHLFAGFEAIQSAEIETHTMNGHPARATQLLLRKKLHCAWSV